MGALALMLLFQERRQEGRSTNLHESSYAQFRFLVFFHFDVFSRRLPLCTNCIDVPIFNSKKNVMQAFRCVLNKLKSYF